MKTDVNGCSTTDKGQENYEEFYSSVLKKKLVQYEYRTITGDLFTCVCSDLQTCREKKDKYLKWGYYEKNSLPDEI